MNLLVYLVISLLIITKLMDVLSTIKRIEYPQIETNPLHYPVGVDVSS